MKKQVSFTRFMLSVVDSLEADGRWSTARLYVATLNALTLFAGGKEIMFSMLTPAWLKEFETYLRNRQRKWNTVSTYMRVMRATYNRAVAAHLAIHKPYLFSGVYTGVKREHKRVLPAATMHALVYAEPHQPLKPEVAESREWLRMMFLLQGMPFVDLAHLHHSDYDAEKALLTCHRQKTDTPLVISLTPEAMRWIEQHRNRDRNASPYLLNILSGRTTGREEHREYARVLDRFNRNLGKLARIQGVDVRISSYIARHTWATLAKYCRVPNELICDALGHTSVKTTETYLKSFDNGSLRRANNKVIGLVKRAVTS